MSQAGEIDVTGTHPEIPTEFVADVGTAVPIANTLEILGTKVSSGTTPVQTTASGNTLTVNVQTSQAIAATDATKIGLSNFDSTSFGVDGNGFVTLIGGGPAAVKFDVQANTAPGTDPVIPTAGGVVTINGAAVSQHGVVLETRSRAANAYNLEIQYAASSATTDATKSGVAHFDSTQFSVDGNGFVSLAGGGEAIDSFHPDSGTDPVVPTAAGLVNMAGSGSITTVGSLNTLTTQLTGLTNHAVLVGAGTTTITKVGPTSTAGQVLQSAGASADPAFSTATYPSTTTINQILYSSAADTVTGLATANRGVLTTGATGVPVVTALATDGQLIIGSTAGAPAAASLSSSDSSVTITPGSNSISLTVAGGTTVGKTITGNSGGALSPTAGNWNILGTGSTTASGSGSTLTVQLTGLTNHNVLVGAGTATVTNVAPSATAGIPLISNGAAADPSFGTALVPGGGTGKTTFTVNGVLIGNGTGILGVTAAGTSGQLLQSKSPSAPAYTTATYPDTTTINQILYSSAANTVTGLATANNSILSTDGSGVPSLGTSLSNDYTFTSSTAGATRTLTVSNTDNTNAASSAVIIAKTGGASAGDAVHQASTTTTVWTWGVDNSVTSPTADPFVIAQGTALGTNNIMSVATSGEINFPLQSAFSAYVGTSDLNVTGDGTVFTLGTGNAFTVIFDQNSDFNTNGTYTAPVTGRYMLCGSGEFAQIGAATDLGMGLVTSNRTWFGGRVGATTATFLGLNLAILADMDAADTAKVTMTASGTTKTVDTNASATTPTVYFTGYLAC